jgi:hypothetical protein
VTQPGAEGVVDLYAVGREKRKRTDEPCKVVTGKRIRKAARNLQGNEYIVQMKGHGGCS